MTFSNLSSHGQREYCPVGYDVMWNERVIWFSIGDITIFACRIGCYWKYACCMQSCILLLWTSINLRWTLILGVGATLGLRWRFIAKYINQIYFTALDNKHCITILNKLHKHFHILPHLLIQHFLTYNIHWFMHQFIQFTVVLM